MTDVKLQENYYISIMLSQVTTTAGKICENTVGLKLKKKIELFGVGEWDLKLVG